MTKEDYNESRLKELAIFMSRVTNTTLSMFAPVKS